MLIWTSIVQWLVGAKGRVIGWLVLIGSGAAALAILLLKVLALGAEREKNARLNDEIEEAKRLAESAEAGSDAALGLDSSHLHDDDGYKRKS